MSSYILALEWRVRLLFSLRQTDFLPYFPHPLLAGPRCVAPPSPLTPSISPPPICAVVRQFADLPSAFVRFFGSLPSSRARACPVRRAQLCLCSSPCGRAHLPLPRFKR